MKTPPKFVTCIIIIKTKFYNSSCRKSPSIWLSPPPTLIPIWLSMIWNNSLGCGTRPASILLHIGMSFMEISNAPVEISWVSTALHRKKVIIQAYSLFSIIQDHQPGVGWPNWTNGLKDTSTAMITNIFNMLIACEIWRLYPWGGKLPPSMARLGYFCCSIPAYCWNTFWYPHE